MATETASNRCSMCQKNAGMCMCAGCKHFFCVKHFIEHRQQLSALFDYEVVRPHDELLEQINQAKDCFADLSSQIDQWEYATIKKVQQTAERARQQITELINGKRDKVTDQFGKMTEEIRRRREEDDFAENDVEQLRQKINRLHELLKEQTPKMIVVFNDEINWDCLISIEKEKDKGSTLPFNIDSGARWIQNGVIVGGGNGRGNGFYQLCYPYGLYVDDDQTVYIADFENNRIVEWKFGAKSGQVVAGGRGPGNQAHQLDGPVDVVVDKRTDSLIICDSRNEQVVRWPRRGGTSGETIISNIKCCGLAMDNDGFLYVSDSEKHEIQRWRVGETHGIVVAGANERGCGLHQLNSPGFVFVDRNLSVYVSDECNHRVVKWLKGAKKGVVVAGGQGNGNALTQLSQPRGVVVDQFGSVYVADIFNDRIMCWPKGATQGSIIVGGNLHGKQTKQLDRPLGLSFDRQGNLYVVDHGHDRIQRFSIDRRS